jgi:hypothetical protein
MAIARQIKRTPPGAGLVYRSLACVEESRFSSLTKDTVLEVRDPAIGPPVLSSNPLAVFLPGRLSALDDVI